MKKKELFYTIAYTLVVVIYQYYIMTLSTQGINVLDENQLSLAHSATLLLGASLVSFLPTFFQGNLKNIGFFGVGFSLLSLALGQHISSGLTNSGLLVLAMGTSLFLIGVPMLCTPDKK